MHISNVALPRNAPNGKIHLLASMGKDVKELTIATLQKDKVETVALDIYVNVSQQVTLSVAGAQGAELHLSGFFEPQRDEMDENMFLEGEDEEEEESEEEAAAKNGGKLNQSLKQAKANALKNARAAIESDEDEDEDEEDYDDEEGEDEDEDEEESDEDNEVLAKKP